MRALGLVVVLAALAGCVIEDVPDHTSEPLDQEESVRLYAQGWCDRNADRVLGVTTDPFYWGKDGAVGGDELESRIRQAVASKAHPGLSCHSRFDFTKLESLTKGEVEARYNISVADYVAEYSWQATDRFLIVPPFPNQNSDDPLQGFWRPSEDKWRIVAVLGT